MQPKAKRKYVPDTGFKKDLGGYVMRVLLQRNIDKNGYQAIAKDLEGVADGYGPTERDAMVMVKNNLKAKLIKFRDENKGVVPMTEISCARNFGAVVKWVLVRLDPVETPDAAG